MGVQHADLAAGRWVRMSLAEQMANIGSELERALSWRAKNNPDYSRRAAARALELADLSLAGSREFSRLKEIARMREILVDFFYGANRYGSSETSLGNYFLHFARAARRDR